MANRTRKSTEQRLLAGSLRAIASWLCSTHFALVLQKIRDVCTLTAHLDEISAISLCVLVGDAEPKAMDENGHILTGLLVCSASNIMLHRTKYR